MKLYDLTKGTESPEVVFDRPRSPRTDRALCGGGASAGPAGGSELVSRAFAAIDLTKAEIDANARAMELHARVKWGLLNLLPPV